MEDSQIIELLFARNEQGLQLTEAKYAHFYKGILRKTIRDPSDIEECANDVLMALWNSIPPNSPSHYPAYIGRIARRIGINRFKFNTRQRRSRECTILLSELEGCIPAQDGPENCWEAKQLQQSLNAFLTELDPQTRVLFVRRYFYLESVRDLAEKFDVSASFVSVRLHRARAALRRHLEKEGIAL
jgi:RNA polymerase sigma-70 factor (ECF subfamily)